MKTSVIPVPKATWYTVDAEGQTLGRLAAKVAHVLRGKHRPDFSPHQLNPDHIIITNAEKLKFPQGKLMRKHYFFHTGYFGHSSTKSLKTMMEDDPVEVMRLAIKGMLPVNRLKFQMLKHVHIVKGPEHKYAAQKPVTLNLPTL